MEMKIENFTDLIARQKAKQLTTTLYENMRNCKEYGLKDKTTKQALDVMSLIANGFINKNKKKQLQQAQEELNAIQSNLYIFLELGSIDNELLIELFNTIQHTYKMIGALCKLFTK